MHNSRILSSRYCFSLVARAQTTPALWRKAISTSGGLAEGSLVSIGSPIYHWRMPRFEASRSARSRDKPEEKKLALAPKSSQS
jgi:hypothetical protein